MFVIDQIILLSAFLILLGILSSKISARLGLPVLVMFLVIGMLAGEDGIGQIAFDNVVAAHALGTLALALILFDGGLRTPLTSIKLVWKPASILATVGVLITALLTGLAATYILGVPLLVGLLLGAIVGSTDAAAVFSLLRNAGIHINARLKAILEIESASNDPMAIFLTVGLLEILTSDTEPGAMQLFQLFVAQMGVGAIVGLLTGWLSLKVINGVALTASGLYPVLVTALGLLSFGLAASLGGSGFLAIFICGVVIGNRPFVFQRSTFRFHDGLAWLSQITMFVVLGLLVNPQSLLEVWLEGLLIAAALILARPVAVVPVLKLFGFNARESALVSWVGLRGSVPIILAVFPLVFGLPQAPLIFNVVFFVVLISATLQGSTLPLVARRLRLTEPAPSTPAAELEITSFGDVDTDIVTYMIDDHPATAGRLLSRMALPDSVVVAMIARGPTMIIPRGSTRLSAGDHLFVMMRPALRPYVDWALGHTHPDSLQLSQADIPFKGTTRLEDIAISYGLMLGYEPTQTLEDYIRASVTGPLEVNTTVMMGDVTLKVLGMLDDRVTTVSVLLPKHPATHSQLTATPA